MTRDLYALMPAVHRRRDEETDGPLRGLFAVLQAQHDLLHRDVEALFDNAFVETCEPWLLPYVAELVAAGRLGRRLHPGLNTRALVADTLGDRRRKGVPATLERVVAEATGWSARVIEPRDRLAATPTAAHAASGRRAPTVRDRGARALAGGPLDAAPRTPRAGPGPIGPDTLEIRLWRLQSAPLAGVEAAVAAGGGGRRTFHPLGLDVPLFPPPADGFEPERPGRGPPAPVARAVLALDLANGVEPPFALALDGAFLEAASLQVADLSTWEGSGGAGVRALVDPQLGRVRLLHPEDHHRRLRTDHAYGCVADLGAGAHLRPALPTDADRRRWGGWRAATAPHDAGDDLTGALRGWRRQGGDGVVRFGSSATLRPGADAASWTIELAGRRLALTAAQGERPCLLGDLHVRAEGGGVLILDGLMIGGTVHLHGSAELVLRHATVWPGHGRDAVVVTPAAAAASVRLEQAVVGAVASQAPDVTLHGLESILEGVTASGPAERAVARLEACTVAGPAHVRELHALDSLFLDEVDAADVSTGSVVSCWLPDAARIPGARSCLSPAGGRPGVEPAPAPRFASRRRGRPGHLHPRSDAAGRIETGASDGRFMGAYRGVGDSLRRDNLADALAEHAPFHLRPLVTYVD